MQAVIHFSSSWVKRGANPSPTNKINLYAKLIRNFQIGRVFGLIWLRTATSSGQAAKRIIDLWVPHSAGNYFTRRGTISC
jgi:hypothetical protein